MKRRTFIKGLVGIGSLLAVWKPLRYVRASSQPYDAHRVHRSAGKNILAGRDRGCSSPLQNEDGHVNFEKGLIELECRHL